MKKTAVHISNFGRFIPEGVTVDLDGYIALPGAELKDHRYEGVDIDIVMIETMPKYLRNSHCAAGNSGRWPQNGAKRFRVDRNVAEEMVKADPEWTEIIEDEADYWLGTWWPKILCGNAIAVDRAGGIGNVTL